MKIIQASDVPAMQSTTAMIIIDVVLSGNPALPASLDPFPELPVMT